MEEGNQSGHGSAQEEYATRREEVMQSAHKLYIK